jgi:hypothetical protein
VGAGEKNGTDISAPQSREREREGVSALGLAPTGEACLSGTKGSRTRARGRGLGLVGWFGPKWLFPFSWNFYCLFYLFSLGLFNLNSNQDSNLNQIKYVQQFKEYLGSI